MDRTFRMEDLNDVHKDNKDSMEFQKLDHFPKLEMLHANDNFLYDKQKTVNKNLNSYHMRNNFNVKWDSNSRKRPIISSYLEGPKTEGFDVSHAGPLTTFNEGWNFKNPNPCISPHIKGPFGFEVGGTYGGDFQMNPSFEFNHLRSEDDHFYRDNSENFLRVNRNGNENLKSGNNLFVQMTNKDENQKRKDFFYKEERNDRRGLMRKMEKNGNDEDHMDPKHDEASKKKERKVHTLSLIHI